MITNPELDLGNDSGFRRQFETLATSGESKFFESFEFAR